MKRYFVIESVDNPGTFLDAIYFSSEDYENGQVGQYRWATCKVKNAVKFSSEESARIWANDILSTFDFNKDFIIREIIED